MLDETQADLVGSTTFAVGRLMIHTRASLRTVPTERQAAVLVHGLGMSSRYMEPLARELARDFRVFAPDQPGFGKSGKPDRALTVRELADFFAAWLDAADLDRAAFIGNSFGCQIAADLAARHPRRVVRLVLQGPTTDASARTLPRQLARWIWNSWGEPRATNTLVVDYHNAGIGRVLRTLRYVMDDAIEDKLPRIPAPTLVIRGTRDRIVPQDWAETVARLLPNGRLVVVPGAAHTMNHHWPRQFARVVRPFLLAADADRPCHSRRHG
jgi:2-hydroxy-6-oxonona-2,4-dienedioate hydrolase